MSKLIRLSDGTYQRVDISPGESLGVVPNPQPEAKPSHGPTYGKISSDLNEAAIGRSNEPMIAYEPGYHKHWEDNYSATLYENFQALRGDAQTFWMAQFGHLNWPIWVEYDRENEHEFECGPTVSVGVVMPRHGEVTIYVAPATEEQYQEIVQMIMRVWSLRADVGFVRYGGERPLPRPAGELGGQD